LEWHQDRLECLHDENVEMNSQVLSSKMIGILRSIYKLKSVTARAGVSDDLNVLVHAWSMSSSGGYKVAKALHALKLRVRPFF